VNQINRRTALAVLAASPVWRLAAATQVDAPVTSLVYSPDGELLLAGSQAGVSIHDAHTLKPLDRYRPAMDNVHDLRFNHDGTLVAIAGGNPGVEGIVELVDWPARELRQRVRWHDDIIDSVDFSSDGRHWVAASADQVCSVFVASQTKPVTRFTEHSKGVRSVRFLPNAQTIVSASRDETLRVWETVTGKTLRTLHNHADQVHALALRPQAADTLPMIASAAADLTIRFWQPSIGRMVRFIKLDHEPLAIEWSHDGNQLWVGCRDGVCRCVDPDQVRIIAEQPVSDAWLWALAVATDHSAALIAGDSHGQLHQPFACEYTFGCGAR